MDLRSLVLLAFSLGVFVSPQQGGADTPGMLRQTHFETNGPCYGMTCFPGGTLPTAGQTCATRSWQPGEEWCQEEVAGGGWNGSKGVRLYIRQGADQFDFGWYFGSGRSWQVGDMAVWRFRIRYDDNFRWDGSGSQQNKITNQGQSGNRFVIHNEKGSWTSQYCTPLDPQSGGTYGPDTGSIAVKAGIANPCAGPVPITHGQWYHVQIGIQSSSSGTGSLRIWVNNNNLSQPNAATTGLTFGVTNWDSSWNFGGFWTDQHDTRSQGWIVDDLETATDLDPNWYPGGSVDTTRPARPQSVTVR